MTRSRNALQARQSNTPKWFNSPISCYEGSLEDIQKHIPEFERRSFSLTQPGNHHTRLNEHLDTIVRRPTQDDPDCIPIGVVSKEYTLISHSEVLKVATDTFKNSGFELSEIKTKLEITEYGERMALSMFLPEVYSFDPGDGNKLALRLECFNSVEGSTRFRALMGWFRSVCSNGLIVGVTQSDFKRRHTGDIPLMKIGKIFTGGIARAEEEKKNFKKWRKQKLKADSLKNWINEDLKKGMGFKAAARAYNIADTGYDVRIIGAYKDNTPSSIPVERVKRVPGAPPKSKNLFDISQTLAWLAKERRDLQEQLEWKEKIPGLMETLMK